jgi:DsbC/DsbD-like thiol-disulfide interchange protein
MTTRSYLLLIAALAGSALHSQRPATEPPVQWTTSVSEGKAGELALQVVATIDEGWHVYALTLPRNDGPLPTIFTFEPADTYVLAGEMMEPSPEQVEDPNFMMVVRHHSHKPVFSRTIKRRSADAFIVKAAVEYMTCNNTMCLPPVTVPLVFPIEAQAE